ncbi:VOC family protein [Devosia lacusdianchii]|jgi:catechol 2,3-dioxygenase-like lactoylglutathione lyase family enzyme|uniref:VOC family protein n=1 Tax=Devosia lacusdianchii TaxID=2917991 RepID=UPI001F050E85|nr:VOC family protein [Devosia sp. JXJ CY 41]
MLKDKDSAPIVAVKDLARARDFYANKLGLELVRGDDNVLEFKTGKTTLAVYVSDYAGTNKANAVVWDGASDIEAIVADLASRGVTFEHYPDMGMAYKDGIHSSGEFKAVWLKDPDGNILHINSM